MRPPLLVLLPALGALAACDAGPWKVVTRTDDAWLLSVSARGDGILCVGGAPGPAGQPGTGLILRLRGGRIDRLPSPRPGVLWWVHETGAVAWLAGEGGTVLRYDEARDPPLEVIPTDTRATLYGLWAFSDGEVWAVGGDERTGGVVLHGGRGGLVTDASVPRSGVLYKIYAASPARLFVVGAGGALLRYRAEQGAAPWVRDPSPVAANETLFTVHGRGEAEVYAVGGLGQARLLRWDGLSWSPQSTPGLGGLSGVFADDGVLFLVGGRGLIAEGPGAGPFAPARLGEPIAEDLHAVFAHGAQRLAVGGNLALLRVAPPRGVLLRQGP